MTSELERDFYKDCANKKRTAYGVHKKNRTGKGAVKLPSDYLSRKEMKELMNTEITTEDLSLPMPLKSFYKLSAKNQKLQLEIWGNVYGHSSATIGKLLGVSQGTGYRILAKLDMTESFKAKYAEESEDKDKRKEQTRRLLEVLGKGSEVVEKAEEETFEASPATGMPKDEPVVEKPVEPLMVVEEKKEVSKKPIARKPVESFSTNISGRGDIIEAVVRAQLEAMSACLDQIDEDAVYNVQMTFYKL